MVLEAPTMYPEVHEVQAPPGKGLHGYYRKANGWIVTGPTTPSNRSDYEYKGFTFLAKYGQFKNVNDLVHEVDTRGVPWNSYTEPWRRIFQLGGTREFPVEQIIAFRWHIRPPYKEAQFPQLQGVDITDVPCPECDRFVASALRPQAATRMLKTHLMSKIDERHEYTITDLRELGKEWDLNFETSRTRHREQREPVEEEETVEMEEEVGPVDMTPNELSKRAIMYACRCGWAPPITSKRPDSALSFHKRKCQSAGQS